MNSTNFTVHLLLIKLSFRVSQCWSTDTSYPLPLCRDAPLELTAGIAGTGNVTVKHWE